jgi:hypothetical protein
MRGLDACPPGFFRGSSPTVLPVLCPSTGGRTGQGSNPHAIWRLLCRRTSIDGSHVCLRLTCTCGTGAGSAGNDTMIVTFGQPWGTGQRMRGKGNPAESGLARDRCLKITRNNPQKVHRGGGQAACGTVFRQPWRFCISRMRLERGCFEAKRAKQRLKRRTKRAGDRGRLPAACVPPPGHDIYSSGTMSRL